MESLVTLIFEEDSSFIVLYVVDTAFLTYTETDGSRKQKRKKRELSVPSISLFSFRQASICVAVSVSSIYTETEIDRFRLISVFLTSARKPYLTG